MDNSLEIPENEFISLQNTLQYFFANGFLSDIECRKIACTHYAKDRRGAIYHVMKSKDPEDFAIILEIFANNIHPLWNHTILNRIFGFLDISDVQNCRLVCKKWNTTAEPLFDKLSKSKFISLCPTDLDSDNGLKENDARPETTLGKNTEESFSDALSDIRYMDLDVLLEKEFNINSVENINCNINTDNLRASIFEILQSNFQENPLKLLATYFKTTQEYEIKYSQENSKPTKADTETDMNNVSMMKAMGISEVFIPIFELLQISDIKNLRCVCRQLYFSADVFLRKRTTVKFTSFFSPRNFINAFNYFPHQHLPITDFEFRNIVLVSELEDLFFKWGKNIKYLRLWKMNLRMDNTTKISHFDISGYFRFCPNLTELCIRNDGRTVLEVCLDQLHDKCIKTLSLHYLHVKVNDTNKKIGPSTVILRDVTFFLEDVLSEEICLNDFLDFSRATHIDIISRHKQIQTFDWARDCCNPKQRVRFEGPRFLNWLTSSAKLNYLELDKYPLGEKSQMEIKQLHLSTPCGYLHYNLPYEINLGVLPSTLKKLWVIVKLFSEIQFNERIDLPNLRFLSIQAIPTRVLPDTEQLISKFSGCNKLTDFECSIQAKWFLDVSLLPKSLRRMNIEGDFEVRGTGLDLDVLIMSKGGYSFCTNIMRKIKTKIFVVTWKEQTKDETKKDVLSFILENKQLEKIVVWLNNAENCNSNIIFEESLLANHVDRKSEFYEFVNGRGLAISKEQFARYEDCMYDQMEDHIPNHAFKRGLARAVAPKQVTPITMQYYVNDLRAPRPRYWSNYWNGRHNRRNVLQLVNYI